MKKKRYLTLPLFLLILVFSFVATGCSPRKVSLSKEEIIRKKLAIKRQIKWNNDVINQMSIYDDNGLMTGERWLNPKGQVVTSRALTYNEKSLKLEEVIWYKGDSVEKSKYQYTYDKKGNLTIEQRFTPLGDLILQMRYGYENNRLVKEVTEGSRENLLTERMYEYEDGNLIGFVARNNYGKIVNRQRYEYDEQNKKIKELWFGNEEEPVKTKNFKYDGEFLIEEYIYDKENELERKVVYEYGDNGLIRLERWLDSEGEIITENIYTYDH